MLEKNSNFIDRGYLKKWLKESTNKNGFFKPSFLRPSLKPVFPHEDQIILHKEDKIQRKNKRAVIRDRKMAEIKADIKAQIHLRRYVLVINEYYLNYDHQ